MEDHTGINCLSGYLFTNCDGGPYWRKLFKWLFIYKFIKSKKNGETLKKEGWNPGKEMGKEIKRLRYLEIEERKSKD